MLEGQSSKSSSSACLWQATDCLYPPWRIVTAETLDVYFPISLCMTRSRCLRCTRWLASTSPTNSLPDRPTATPTIQHRSPALSAAGSGWPGRVPSHVLTEGFSFWTTPRKPNPSDVVDESQARRGERWSVSSWRTACLSSHWTRYDRPPLRHWAYCRPRRGTQTSCRNGGQGTTRSRPHSNLTLSHICSISMAFPWSIA